MQRIDYWLAYYNICASIDQLSKYVKIDLNRSRICIFDTIERCFADEKLVNMQWRKSISSMRIFCNSVSYTSIRKQLNSARSGHRNSILHIKSTMRILFAMEDYLLYALIFRKSMFDCVAVDWKMQFINQKISSTQADYQMLVKLEIYLLQMIANWQFAEW